MSEIEILAERIFLLGLFFGCALSLCATALTVILGAYFARR